MALPQPVSYQAQPKLPQRPQLTEGRPRLRVAFIAGTLGQAGAEKQLVYMAGALHTAGVDVRIYSLTRGEYYEQVLTSMGMPPIWVGRYGSPPARVVAITRALLQFRPHIVQSAHFYTNLYASLAAPFCKAAAIGAVRSDITLELDDSRFWGRWLLRLPPTLLANSYAAGRNAWRAGVAKDAVEVLPNVINLQDFDRGASEGSHVFTGQRKDNAVGPVVVAVGRLIPERRYERFLAALALAREEVSGVTGLIIGEGSERRALTATAAQLGLMPHAVQFLGHRTDIPHLLSQATVMLLTSDHEGFPNVLLEAMAASLPVITTPAGDAASVVQDGVTGYVVPFDDVTGMAGRIVQLARNSEAARQMGAAGRQRVEQHYSIDGLENRLLSIYERAARKQHNGRLVRALA